MDVNGQSIYSNILRVNRDEVTNAKVLFCNRVTTMLALRLIDMNTDNLSIRIIDNSGREISGQNVKIKAGENYFKPQHRSNPSRILLPDAVGG